MNTVTQQPSEHAKVKPLIEVGNTFEAKRPEWMSDEQWGSAFDALADRWRTLLREAASQQVGQALRDV